MLIRESYAIEHKNRHIVFKADTYKAALDKLKSLEKEFGKDYHIIKLDFNYNKARDNILPFLRT